MQRLEGEWWFLLALGAVVAIALVQGRGDGIPQGAGEVQAGGGAGGEGGQGLLDPDLLEAAAGGGQGLEIGLAVVLVLGSQADEEDALGLQPRDLVEQEGAAGLGLQIPPRENPGQIAAAGHVDALGGCGELAFPDDAEEETGGFAVRQVTALDAQFHRGGLVLPVSCRWSSPLPCLTSPLPRSPPRQGGGSKA